ncbi:putative MFS peptide transporter [Rhizodiscina lignyota]|uniref:MFS peptide transporter n=1 Tax=Rhizodiscina lignyota TaxID=1504668 RepID=A0A9P4M3H6_9PEZI|nr:putative MFS peptide transporter [Rhizodiscina lignyota]
MAPQLKHDVEALTKERSESWSVTDERYPPPTDEERATLRKVAERLPWIAYTLCIVEFAERASYYGASQIFNNFMEFPLPKDGNGAGAPPAGTEETAGALGKGLQFSNAFVLLFQFLAYAFPILGAWIGDARTGRYNAVAIGVVICGVAHVIMIGGAAPSLLQAGHGAAPFIISLLLLAFGAGIFKPSILPIVLDQYQHQREYVKVLKSGEKVLVDPETTIQRITLLFYAFVNIGAFFAIATTYAEKRVGYWLAFLLPGIVYFLLPLVMLLTYKKTIRYPPKGSELTNVFKIIGLAIKRNKGKVWGKGFWERVKPSVLAREGITVEWTDKLVDDTRRTMVACMMFLYWPIWYLNDGGIGSVSTNQGAAMTTAGAPNDLLNNFNPLTIIVFAPFLSHVVYPTLNKMGIKFGRVNRCVTGFTLAWISGVIGAIIQWRVYVTSPCGYQASTCTVGTGVSPLSIWTQIPNYSLGAMSECFVMVTGYEIAYARSPPNMKALVMAIFLFMNALSAALGEILTPAIIDPHLIWVWAGPAIALAAQTAIFWWKYRWMNSDEFMTIEEVEEAERQRSVTAREDSVAHTDEKKAFDDKSS